MQVRNVEVVLCLMLHRRDNRLITDRNRCTCGCYNSLNLSFPSSLSLSLARSLSLSLSLSRSLSLSPLLNCFLHYFTSLSIYNYHSFSLSLSLSLSCYLCHTFWQLFSVRDDDRLLSSAYILFLNFFFKIRN